MRVDVTTAQTFTSLIKLLSKCTSSLLEHINVSDNGDAIDGQVVAACLKSLHVMHSLKSLGIPYFEVGKLGCMALAQLMSNPSLNINYLQLEHNDINDACIVIVSSAFIRNRTLKGHDLGNNANSKITTTRWGTFTAVLYNPECSLEVLKLQCSEICDDSILSWGALVLNKSVKHLDLQFNQHITMKILRVVKMFEYSQLFTGD